MAEIWRTAPGEAVSVVCEDLQPTMQGNGAGGVRVELTGLRGSYWIELTRTECERIAKLIDPDRWV